jgi:transcriptional regulator with XRE-family HTH domain
VSKFGDYIRRQREKLKETDPSFSLRKVAAEIGVQPSFLSKVERGLDPPPSEKKIRALAAVLGEDPDVLLALAGKVSSDLQAAICRRPQVFAQLIRELKNLPDRAVRQIARDVREGRW